MKVVLWPTDCPLSCGTSQGSHSRLIRPQPGPGDGRNCSLLPLEIRAGAGREPAAQHCVPA